MDIGDNVIDSRDVEKETNELKAGLRGTPFCDDLFDSDELRKIYDETHAAWHDYFDTDDVEKLINLLDFKEQGGNFPEWNFGATFILDEYFVEYAKELASEIGCVPEGYENYFSYEKWANDLLSDYSSIEVDGNTYWVRS